jgi:hypothetical protein
MQRPQPSRRAFLAACAAALGAAPAGRRPQESWQPPSRDDEWLLHLQLARMGRLLRDRHRDLRRHFVFEYYPWYATSPWRHWNEGGRIPPAELSASSLPFLGAYDSRSIAIIEQHARWMAEAGVGTVNLSWWGRGSFEDQATHVVMDVMRAFDIKVMFHLEPYSSQRGVRFADDVSYILREYGERRAWDTLLLLEDADGRAGPMFKLFVALLPPTSTNCLGVTTPIGIYVPDDVWRQQLERVRRDFAAEFDRITFVADSLDAPRTLITSFDAGAVGNPYIRPEQWPALTEPFDTRGIPFSFAVNAGFDALPPKTPPRDPCYGGPPVFEPELDVSWEDEASRERAHRLCEERIEASLLRTLAHQTNPRSANWQRGFLHVPVNSFNEWHEGTQFEPMKSFRDLAPSERRLYHNPLDGSYRLDQLRNLLQFVLDPDPFE